MFVDLDILGVAFDAIMNFEKNLRSVPQQLPKAQYLVEVLARILYFLICHFR